MGNQIITPTPLSGFPEHLPEIRLVENKLIDTIRRNYELAGFTPIETSAVERIEILTSKGADDKEIFTVGRLHEDPNEKPTKLALHFDLTVPMARYVVQNYNELTFPFRRYQIQKSWRGERAQAGRFREFYQADIDIIGDGELPISADVEILTTINNVLAELNIGEYQMHINNKKVIQGFVQSLGIDELDQQIAIMRIIDKAPKITEDELRGLLGEYLNESNTEKVIEFANIVKQGNEQVLSYLGTIQNQQAQEGFQELEAVYKQALQLGINPEKIVIDPGIARGLGYYTGTIYETFLIGNESLGSICSGGRYENLASHFTEKKLPGVGVSIGLSRLISKLIELDMFDTRAKTPSKVLITRLQEKYVNIYLQILSQIRGARIPAELYLQEGVKIGKQLTYGDKKGIPYAIIAGEDELEKNEVQLKHLYTGEKELVEISNIANRLQELTNAS